MSYWACAPVQIKVTSGRTISVGVWDTGARTSNAGVTGVC